MADAGDTRIRITSIDVYYTLRGSYTGTLGAYFVFHYASASSSVVASAVSVGDTMLFCSLQVAFAANYTYKQSNIGATDSWSVEWSLTEAGGVYFVNDDCSAYFVVSEIDIDNRTITMEGVALGGVRIISRSYETITLTVNNEETTELYSDIVDFDADHSYGEGLALSVSLDSSTDYICFALPTDITVSETSTELTTPSSGSKSFTAIVEGNADLQALITATSSADWLTVSYDSSTGEGTARWTANTTGSARTATITFSAEGATADVIWTISQSGASITVDPSAVSVGYSGGTKTITITANVDYTVYSTCSGWVSLNTSTGLLTISANTDETQRDGALYFFGNDFEVVAVLSITQKAAGDDSDEETDEEDYTKRYLWTWQYAARKAYIILYYMSGSSLAFEIWNAYTAEKKSKLATLKIESFNGSLASLNLYSVNDVVYIAESTLRLKKIYREESSDGTYSFAIADIDVKVDPVLEEYADRNVFTVPSGTYAQNSYLTVSENELTDIQIANGAEPFFTSDTSWRGTGGQMLMLKKRTEQMTTWALLYTASTSDGADGRSAITPSPAPDYLEQNDYGGRAGETENTTDYYDEENDWATDWIFAYGSISIETTGKWSGKLVVDLWTPADEVDSSGEPAEYQLLATIDVHNAMANKSITRDISTPGSKIRIRCVRRERARAINVYVNGDTIKYREYDNDTGCYITLSNAQEQPVYLRLVSVSDGQAQAKVIYPFEGGFTSTSFAEGAWCDRYGYPKTVGVFQERMVFGGNTKKPCTLWLSKTNEWTNFISGTDSSSPIFATASTDNADAIQWLEINKSYIQFGSLSGEWYFGSSDSSALKPSNYSFQRLSFFGSTAGVKAVAFNTSVIVAKNGGEEVVDVSYNTLSEEGSGVNLSLYAEHLFEANPVVAMQATSSPKSILWALAEDGTLCSFTYEGNNGVFAWARHTILDGVLAISAFRRGERDILAMLVQDGDAVVLGELDPNRGDDYDKDSKDLANNEYIFEDERASSVAKSLVYSEYESRMIPTPIASPYNNLTYGQKNAFKSFDIYLKTHNGSFDSDVWADGTLFTVKLGESKAVVCNEGWLKANVRKVFGENRIVLPMTTGWTDLALVDITVTHPSPLTITAIGADIAGGS